MKANDPHPPEAPEPGASGARRSYALDRLTWNEVHEVIARDQRMIFPIGALEQHGPHLPLGTNSLIVERLAGDLSAELGILVAPTFPYGVITPTRDRFPGRTTLQRKTLHRTINELLARWEDHGIREFVLLTAQRHDAHLDALLMALTSGADTTVVDLHAIDVSDLLDHPARFEHAGELETSLMLHLAPELVRLDRVRDAPLSPGESRRSVRHSMPTPPRGSGGVVGYPGAATAEKGERIYRRLLAAIRDGWLSADQG